MILKKNFLQALVGRKKLHAAQRKEKKNSCTATSKEKMLQRACTKTRNTGTPEHRNTGTPRNIPEQRNTGTAEKPRNSEFDGVVLFSHLQTMLKM